MRTVTINKIMDPTTTDPKPTENPKQIEERKKKKLSIEEIKKKILMPPDALKMLEDLYVLRSYSGFEEPMRRDIMAFLKSYKIPYINYNGNIIGINYPSAPLFSAHMDMVNTDYTKLRGEEYMLDGNHVFTLDEDTCIRVYKSKDKTPASQTSLGADDKNGIWVILMLLRMGKKINFAFCHSEETGGEGSRQIISDKDLQEKIAECSFGVIIDRRNAHDIIGYNNKYCMALDDKLEKFAKANGFKFETTTGSVSDADRFSQIIECVNLSCGYYEPHTSREYTNLNELWNTLQFCSKIISDFKYESVSEKRMRSFKGLSSTYSTSSTDNTTYAAGVYGGNYTGRPLSSTVKSNDFDYSRIITKSNNTEVAQKKTSEKINIQGMTNSTDGTINEDVDDNIKLIQEWADASYYLAAAREEGGATYEHELDTWFIPLYQEEEDIETDKVWSCVCPKCGKRVYIAQNSLDQLFLGYYQNEDVFGICTGCENIQKVTSEVAQVYIY